MGAGLAVPLSEAGLAVPLTETGLAVPLTETGLAVPLTEAGLAVPLSETGLAVSLKMVKTYPICPRFENPLISLLFSEFPSLVFSSLLQFNGTEFPTYSACLHTLVSKKIYKNNFIQFLLLQWIQHT
jgi:hypothetical protein